jgi:MFS family permease
MDLDAAKNLDLAAVPSPLPAGIRAQIMIYLGVLLVLLGFGSPAGGLIGLPISFLLKNKLHLEAHQSAIFGLIAGAPTYLSFLFGFLRDTWNPFGLRDRGFLILFGAIGAAIYVYFAFTTPNAVTMLAAVILLTTAFLFVASAQAGLSSAIGQQHVMSGQVSTVWNIFLSVPTLAAFVAGGLLSDQLEGKHADQAARVLFFIGGGFMAAIALYGVWKPKSVFDNVHSERAADAHPWDDFNRLIRHNAIWPALLIWLLWNFAPGSVTPLQFYLQNTLHSNDAAFANWNAIFAASFIPTFMVFGVLCRKFPLRTLLFWGTIIAVPQMVPLLLVHSVTGALLAAIPIGLMGGVATAAYLDLLIRSCPPGLQGTLLMASNAAYYFVSRVGDRLGTELYDHWGGFPICVLAITVVYALILPALWLVPKHLTATTDGEAVEQPQADAFS